MALFLAQPGIKHPSRRRTPTIVITVKNRRLYLTFFGLILLKHILNVCSCKLRGARAHFQLIFKPLINSLHFMSIYSMALIYMADPPNKVT